MIRQLLGLPPPPPQKLAQQTDCLEDLAKATCEAVDGLAEVKAKLVAKANGALYELKAKRDEAKS